MKISERAALLIAGLVSLGVAAAAADAAETITYTYDALGRLTNASSSGTVNNGLSASTSYDPAGNRSSQTVAGGTGGSGMALAPAAPAAGAAGGSARDAPCEAAARAALAEAPDSAGTAAPAAAAGAPDGRRCRR